MLYRVLTPLSHDGWCYAPGDILALDAAPALEEAGAVLPLPNTTPEQTATADAGTQPAAPAEGPEQDAPSPAAAGRASDVTAPTRKPKR